MACSDRENSPPMACKDEQSLQAMVGKSGEAELQSVLTLAYCEWRAAAPGLEPLRLPRARAQNTAVEALQLDKALCL